MMATAHPTFWRKLGLFLLVLTAIAVAGCGMAASAPGASGGSGGADFHGAPGATAPPGPQGNGDGEGGDGDGNGGGVISGAPQDLLIIKTGDMTLQVTGIDAALSAASKQIDELGGYASASQRSGDGESAYASITFR